MTQEDKQLLIKDLSARLAYGIRVSVSGDEFDKYQYPYLLTAISKFEQDNFCKVYSPIYTPLRCPSIENVKPYLRPMSSMTNDERKELSKILNYEFYVDDDFALVAEDDRHRIRLELCEGYVDWLNAHHFDFRGLIPMGLAIEAPENMYKNE